MPRIEYENPLAPKRPDRVARGDKARREQNRRRRETEARRRGSDKEERENADKKDRDSHTQGRGRLVDLEV
jgi:hypothetical protein